MCKQEIIKANMGKIELDDGDLDLENSKLVKIIGKACVIIGLGTIFFSAGYGMGKLADYACKKITHKQIYEHLQNIRLPTELKIDYKNSTSKGNE